MPTMTSHSRKFLVFSLQGSLYALDLAHVAEVCDPVKMSPIPMAPACYSGALNFHGNIVAVIDLRSFLDLTECGPPEKIIVLQQEVASLAFLVDTAHRIISEDEISFSPSPDNRFAATTLLFCDGEAILLDLEKLVCEAESCMQKNLHT